MTKHPVDDKININKKWCDVNKNIKKSYSENCKSFERRKENNYAQELENKCFEFERSQNKKNKHAKRKAENKYSQSLKKRTILAYKEYIKNPSTKASFVKLLRKFWTPSFVENIISLYKESLDDPQKKPFNIPFQNKFDFASDLENKDYFDNLLTIMWLSDQENINLLRDICKEKLNRQFPEGCKNYGLPDDYLFSDLPNPNNIDEEQFVFVHSDRYLRDIVSAPKIPITDWITTYFNAYHTVQIKRVAFWVGNECMLGELRRNINYSNNDIAKNSGSGIKFCVYSKGLEKGKFTVTRWDYEPVGVHFNKFNSRGDFDVNGYYCKKTRHSHVHYYDLKQRLIFTQNQSSDISPTPINCNEDKFERKYKSFEDMIDDFEWQLCCLDEKAPKLYDDDYLKDYALQHCPIEIINGKYVYIENNNRENNRTSQQNFENSEREKICEHYQMKKCEEKGMQLGE